MFSAILKTDVVVSVKFVVCKCFKFLPNLESETSVDFVDLKARQFLIC